MNKINNRRREFLTIVASGIAGFAISGTINILFPKVVEKIHTTTTTTYLGITQVYEKTTTWTELSTKTISRDRTATVERTVTEYLPTTYTSIKDTTTTIIPQHILPNINSWVYQLQDAEPSTIAKSGFELAVIDYSSDGSDETAYTREEIDNMKDNRVIPIAYLSIGEAEEYRFYWREKWRREPPRWLGPENPEWPGNYKVRYWYEEWHGIVLNYLDKIIQQGFSGVYLDLIDSFEYWSGLMEGGVDELSVTEAAGRMITLVSKIAHYSRNIKKINPF